MYVATRQRDHFDPWAAHTYRQRLPTSFRRPAVGSHTSLHEFVTTRALPKMLIGAQWEAMRSCLWVLGLSTSARRGRRASGSQMRSSILGWCEEARKKHRTRSSTAVFSTRSLKNEGRNLQLSFAWLSGGCSRAMLHLCNNPCLGSTAAYRLQ
jgi:hypothetical protein